MTPLHYVDIAFRVIAFLFAISFHESAHAWMANRCGDPTARMLGRISLNPIKHIDPIGTIVMPVIGMLTGWAVLGWAKPTPVDPHNFRNPVIDDIKTAVVGPLSNLIVAGCAWLVLAVIALASPMGAGYINTILSVYPGGLDVLKAQTNSLLMPLSLMAYEFLVINIVLAIFNLLPVPPLDGSHVLRHFLPEPMRRMYDTMGWVALLALVYFGGGFLGRLIWPVLGLFDAGLVAIIGRR